MQTQCHRTHYTFLNHSHSPITTYLGFPDVVELSLFILNGTFVTIPFKSFEPIAAFEFFHDVGLGIRHQHVLVSGEGRVGHGRYQCRIDSLKR